MFIMLLSCIMGCVAYGWIVDRNISTRNETAYGFDENNEMDEMYYYYIIVLLVGIAFGKIKTEQIKKFFAPN